MSIPLRNNKKTEDKRLDRIEEFDERSRNYSIGDIRGQGTTKKLRSYTWRCYESFNQGEEGACVGFSLAHELAARPAEVRGLTYKFIVEDIYWEAQKNDYWQGGSYPGANPRYGGTSLLHGVKRIKELGYIEEYRWAFNIDDVLYGLGHNGPAVIGVNWYKRMTNTNRRGFIKPKGKLVGGHAIMISGINVKEGYVTLKNSWGVNWGVGGYCHLTFADLEYLLKQSGECCFLMHRKSKV